MPKTRNKLSYKEERFIELYLLKYKGNGTQAALEAYNCKDESVAASIASENLRKARIVEEIERITPILPANLTEEKIAYNIAQMAYNSKNESIRTKNSELLAKWKAMLTEKQSIETSEKSYKSGELKNIGTNDLLGELTERLKLSNQGIDTVKVGEKSKAEAGIEAKVGKEST